jgi:hypothetical protein
MDCGGRPGRGSRLRSDVELRCQETDQEIVVEAELPGLDKKDVSQPLAVSVALQAINSALQIGARGSVVLGKVRSTAGSSSKE